MWGAFTRLMIIRPVGVFFSVTLNLDSTAGHVPSLGPGVLHPSSKFYEPLRKTSKQAIQQGSAVTKAV